MKFGWKYLDDWGVFNASIRAPYFLNGEKSSQIDTVVTTSKPRLCLNSGANIYQSVIISSACHGPSKTKISGTTKSDRQGRPEYAGTSSRWNFSSRNGQWSWTNGSGFLIFSLGGTRLIPILVSQCIAHWNTVGANFTARSVHISGKWIDRRRRGYLDGDRQRGSVGNWFSAILVLSAKRKSYVDNKAAWHLRDDLHDAQSSPRLSGTVRDDVFSRLGGRCGDLYRTKFNPVSRRFVRDRRFASSVGIIGDAFYDWLTVTPLTLKNYVTHSRAHHSMRSVFALEE